MSRKRRTTAAGGRPDVAARPRLRGAERDAQLRAALAPLGPEERPAALLIAVAVAGILAVAVVVGALTIHGLSRRGGSAEGGAFLATVLGCLAVAMWQRRYWAVLSFQALLAFQVLVTALALLVARTLFAAGLCVLSVALGGWLFIKLVRVLSRLQVPARAGRGPAA